MDQGIIIAISVSHRKGIKKTNVSRAEVRAQHGIVGDAHAGSGPRQISLLAAEAMDKIRRQGLSVQPGDFAENITTQGIDWTRSQKGDEIQIGETVILEISQIGKTCHDRCAIYEQTGTCIMPEEGIFGKVKKGGIIQAGDKIVCRSARPAKEPPVDALGR